MVNDEGLMNFSLLVPFIHFGITFGSCYPFTLGNVFLSNCSLGIIP